MPRWKLGSQACGGASTWLLNNTLSLSVCMGVHVRVTYGSPRYCRCPLCHLPTELKLIPSRGLTRPGPAYLPGKPWPGAGTFSSVFSGFLGLSLEPGSYKLCHLTGRFKSWWPAWSVHQHVNLKCSTFHGRFSPSVDQIVRWLGKSHCLGNGP